MNTKRDYCKLVVVNLLRMRLPLKAENDVAETQAEVPQLHGCGPAHSCSLLMRA